MEKKRSLSIKPIRFLAFFSFTISFSIILLIFLKTTHNLNSSSDFVMKDPILKGTHFGKDEKETGFGGFQSFEEGPKKSESEITAVTAAKSSKEAGSSSFTPSSKNISVNISVNDSCCTSSRSMGKSALGDYEEIMVKRDIESHVVTIERPNISTRHRMKEKKCDITKGMWVFDESYPLYTNITCPFIDEGFNCQSNGRLDKGYMRWRWQPQDCDVPRFDAKKMLELMRGKRLVFVGDSVNRNEWESMLCLLMGGIKDPKKVYEVRGKKITKQRGDYCFKFEDYKCTVEFYVSHFLVHESKARIGRKRSQTLRIDTIDKGSSRWRRADILVFNTAHWWSHQKTKSGINYYQEGDRVHPRLDVTKAFRRALMTWASWVDKYINPNKTRIFFRSSAPSHFSGGLWNTGGHCREAFRPINATTFTSNYPEKNLIVEEIISLMKNPVTFLNITHLSDYRPDAHPSIYGRHSVNPGVQDCSHWCLPGVPDNWNELLYYYLQSRTKTNFLN